MKIQRLFKKISRSLHSFIEQSEAISMYSEKIHPANLYIRLPHVPLHPSYVEQEKRRMMTENINTALMFALMKH